MISNTAEYALRLVVRLAEEPGQALPAQEVAREIQVPAQYLYKIIQGLSRVGLLRSRRGAGGGVSLQKTPAEISLYEIVTAVSPIKRIHSCPLNLPEHENELCSLHATLDGAAAQAEGCFRRTSLQDLLDQSGKKMFGEGG